MTVLFITGHRGFVGSALMRRCEKLGIEATGIDLPDDILTFDAERVPEGAVIVHLAAVSSVKACDADPHAAAKINVTGSRRMVEIANKRHCQFILASTEWVYDGLGGPCHEDRELHDGNLSHYAISKLAAEQCCRAIALNATILRFGIIYGPRTHASDCALYRAPAYEPGPCDCGIGGSAVESIALSRGHYAKIGSPDTARRFIHVEDIVSGVLASVGRTGCEVFNLTGDKLLTLREICEAAGKFARWSVQDDVPSIRDAPNTKARQALNWKPEYDLEAGLRSLMDAAVVA